MNRNKLLILVAISLGLAVFGVAGSIPNQASAGNPTPVVANYYLSNFSVKFVCGESRGPIVDDQAPDLADHGEALVKPGSYATEINIHNYWYRDVGIRKKVLVLARDPYPNPDDPETTLPPIRVREPLVAKQPDQHFRVVLPPDGATMDDCLALWRMAFNTPPPPRMPLFIGYLVLMSPLDLDVDAVYTAESHAADTSGTMSNTGISIDVERVSGKRVYCPPTSAFPICAPTSAADQVQPGDPSLMPDQ